MPITVISLLSLAIFVTALLSGTFGMAGGMILMAILLAFLPVQTAMTLHAAIQLISNSWRCILWRKHIVWHVLPPYLAGMFAGVTLASTIHYVPDKAVSMIVLGSVPLFAIMVEKRVHLSILNKPQSFVAATCLTFVQMTAGVVGPLLDQLYNKTPFTRHQIISTKAFTQTSMHCVRLLYFGTLIPLFTGTSNWPQELSPLYMILFAVCSIAGTSAAALFLGKMSDVHFKKISRLIILAISVYCLSNGFYMLFSASYSNTGYLNE